MPVIPMRSPNAPAYGVHAERIEKHRLARAGRVPGDLAPIGWTLVMFWFKRGDTFDLHFVSGWREPYPLIRLMSGITPMQLDFLRTVLPIHGWSLLSEVPRALRKLDQLVAMRRRARRDRGPIMPAHPGNN